MLDFRLALKLRKRPDIRSKTELLAVESGIPVHLYQPVTTVQ